MKMRFLCELHQNQIRRQPRQALDLWDKWMTTGQRLMAQHDYVRAVQYVVSSFDIGTLLLEVPELLLAEDEMSHADRFMVAGHYLAEAYRHCGENQKEQNCLTEVHQRLMLELGANTARKPFLKHNIEFSLFMLQRHYQRADRPKSEMPQNINAARQNC